MTRTRLVSLRLPLAAALAVAVGATLAPLPAHAAGNGYSLSAIAPKHGGEPSITTGPNGELYSAWPGGGSNFARSLDNGASWNIGTQPDPSSGDNCVATDQAGAIYVCNLAGSHDPNAVFPADVWKSTDDGNTWTAAKGVLDAAGWGVDGNPFGVDRDWVDAWIPTGKTSTDDAEVALAYHDFYGPSQIWVNMSSDGGKTFGAPIDVMTSPANNPTAVQNSAAALAYSACNTVPTAVKIVKSGAYTGRIWVSWIAADGPTSLATGCNITQLDTFHSIWAAYSDDNGATWTPELVFDGGEGHDASTPFAAFALDNQGNPYYTFAMNLGNEYDMWLVWSKDGGSTWAGQGPLGALTSAGTPLKVNNDRGTHIYPAIAAGDPGHVDVAYLETSAVVPTLPYGKFSPGGGAGDSWNLMIGQGDLTQPVPHWTTTQATPTPMHVGDICNLGIFCVDDTLPSSVGPAPRPTIFGTNRDLLDFIGITLDAQGFAHVAYTDDNTRNAIMVANQISGQSVTTSGPAVVLPEVPAAALLLPVGVIAAWGEWRRRRRITKN